MKYNIDYTLYFITDRQIMSSATIEESVLKAIKGGATLIQLREKNISSADFYEEALKLRKVTKKYGVPLIINDRVDIALAVDADGIHIGKKDLPAGVVRRLIGPNKVVGVSVTNMKEALAAVNEGADYLGIGAMYSTDTKRDAKIVSKNELKDICKAISTPIVTIGGINKKTIHELHNINIDGIAVISAIASSKNVEGAAREMKKLFLEGRGKHESIHI